MIRSCCAAIYRASPPHWRDAGFVLDVDAFASLEEQRKSVQIEADRLRAERNANAKAVGIAKSKGQDVAALLRCGESLGADLQGMEQRLELIQAQITDLQMGLPNILHASVPEGRDETANVEVRRWGMPREFTFEPKDHVALGERLGMDFEAAGRISGARFVVLMRDAGEAASRARAIHARSACPRIMDIAKPTCRTWCMPMRSSARDSCRNSSRINSRCAAIRAST